LFFLGLFRGCAADLGCANRSSEAVVLARPPEAQRARLAVAAAVQHEMTAAKAFSTAVGGRCHFHSFADAGSSEDGSSGLFGASFGAERPSSFPPVPTRPGSPAVATASDWATRLNVVPAAPVPADPE